MNKRTQILKQLASEKQENWNDSMAGTESPINQPVPTQSALNTAADDSLQHNVLFNDLLAEQINAAADQLKLQAQCLQMWLGNFPKAPIVSKLAILRLIQKYELDPFLEEIDLVQYEDQSWQAVITTQGYARLMNACPQFKGVMYSYSESSADAISDWIECAIYRSDRNSPITVREYYAEVKRDSVAWQKMPRRMLRNRAFQQCAKMALGI